MENNKRYYTPEQALDSNHTEQSSEVLNLLSRPRSDAVNVGHIHTILACRNKLKIILAADHAGFDLKEKVKKFLKERDYSILDVGAHELVADDDFPTYMAAAALKVAEDLKGQTKAIIFGGSGQGEAMVANRFPGVRATVWYGECRSCCSDCSKSEKSIIELSRIHNDANVLSIGARFVQEKETLEAIETWLKTPFSSEEKYQRRNDQIDAIE